MLCCINISLPSFEDFAADISHRLRHGGGAAILEDYGAALGFCCEGGGIINGISVKKQFRGQGLGHKLLDRLCSALGGDVYAATNGGVDFYIKNGFTYLDDAVIVRG